MRLPLVRRDLPKRPVIIALVLAVAAGVVAGREKPASELVEASAPRAEKSAAAPQLDLAKLRRAQSDAAQSDPFSPRSFAAPVKQARSAAPPEPPRAPALPFTYAGKLTQDGRTEVFVLRGEELIAIAAGQNIDGEYRVDAITDASIRFTYLPLKLKQSLELGEAGA